MDRTAELKAKIARLQKKKTALLAQSRLLQDFVSLAKSSAKGQMLTAILQKTIELTAELTKAETGSLFLLDPDGVVRDCILTLLHSQPGIFHQGTVDLMEVTAGQLGLALESATLYSKLDEYSRALDAELEKGKQIQKERFFALLEKPASSAPELIERVKADLFNHIRHALQSHDISMIAVHRRG